MHISHWATQSLHRWIKWWAATAPSCRKTHTLFKFESKTKRFLICPLTSSSGAAFAHGSQRTLRFLMLFIVRLKNRSPFTSIVLDLAATLFTPETPKVFFCGPQTLHPTPPSAWCVFKTLWCLLPMDWTGLLKWSVVDFTYFLTVSWWACWDRASAVKYWSRDT